jgi:hypothetical protein
VCLFVCLGFGLFAKRYALLLLLLPLRGFECLNGEVATEEDVLVGFLL